MFFARLLSQFLELFEKEWILEDSLDRFDEVRLQGHRVLLHGVVRLEKVLQWDVVVWKLE